MKLLMGELFPSKGSILINGSPMVHRARATGLGFVYQQNALWDKLTVAEHLALFEALRGLPAGSSHAELLQRVGLGDALSKQSERLSGGQKRKLCILLSMLGSPKFLLMDEPSAGVDQGSALEIWHILQSYLAMNPHSTIVLTTHEMTEAESLGSNICILKNGRLRAQGSVVELAEQFKLGYRVSFAPNQPEAEALVESLFRGAERSISRITGDVVYAIGPAQPQFEEFFASLQKITPAFGVEADGLREVFFRITDED